MTYPWCNKPTLRNETSAMGAEIRTVRTDKNMPTSPYKSPYFKSGYLNN
jgi:hypothetical protein